MKGIIVIDGCDGTGKTTLAKAICDKHDGVYIHNTYRWPTKMPLYHTAALHRALKLARTRLVVIDRLWMSEAIYAEVYRGGSPWPHMGRMIDRIIRKSGGLYILTQSPRGHSEKFEQLKSEREEMYDNVDKVRERFDQLFEGGFDGHDTDYAQQLSVFGMRMRDDVLPFVFSRVRKMEDKGAEAPRDLSGFRKLNSEVECLALASCCRAKPGACQALVLVGSSDVVVVVRHGVECAPPGTGRSGQVSAWLGLHDVDQTIDRTAKI